MAEYALPPGQLRRRAVFGLLDADGWTWATIKATFWFLLIIFLQGYVPDRAYYFTVSPTVDLGFNAISPVNLCPAENKNLPCPAPAGAVIPWEEGPQELALPSGRAAAGAFTSGEHIYIVGGRGADGAATASVLTSTVFEGNLTTWTEAPALPEPRSDAAVLSLGGVPYVIGGSDASGAPTATVFRGVLTQGLLTGWETSTVPLPEPLTDLVGTTTGAGLYIFGGRTADGAISAKTYSSTLTTTGTPTLQAWIENTELPLPEPRANATAASAGGAVYVIGGEGPSGPTNSVYFLAFDTHGLPETNLDTGRPFGWGVSVGQSAGAALPEPRYGHTTFVNSGTLFVLGGYDANGQVASTNFWAVPSSTNGSIRSWQVRPETDLPGQRAEAAAALVGQHAFVVGGTSGSEVLGTPIRADVAPRLPFFRLGLFGLTVPALSIKGEIGQQLGYIVAASAALGNFVILVVIGWMYSHKPETYRFFRWISRGRFRPPPEDEFQV